MLSPAKARQRGFVLIAMSASMFLMLAVMGLAFDIGRIYIARNEAQIFTDAAALAADPNNAEAMTARLSLDA